MFYTIKFIKNRNVILIGIAVLLAFVLRFINLSSIPVSLYWDEASIGYNAYSINETLKDEHGKVMPILFKGFNDYKMPVDIYLSSLSIKLFGLNEFAIRFPSAFLGTLTILFAFLFVKKLFEKDAKFKKLSFPIAFITSFLLAISPWHIQFSRANFESNISLFFIILGLYLFMKGLLHFRFIIFSALSFLIAMYSYRSSDIFVPLLLIILLVLFWKSLIRYGAGRLIIVAALLIIPLIPLGKELTGEGATRAQQTSIKNRVNEIMMQESNQNRKLVYASVFVNNYITNFTPQFLFQSGDPNGRHSARGMGVLYFWELPFLILGLIVVIRKFSTKLKILILSWLFIAPLPAALSIPTPHALRMLNILPMPQLLSAIGIIFLYYYFPKKIRLIYIVILSIIVFAFFANFVKLYKSSNTKLVVSDWADGYKQLVNYTEDKKSNYDKIVVTGYYWQPYIYILLHSKYNPNEYIKSGSSLGFGKYIFGGTSWDKEQNHITLSNIDLEKFAGSKNSLIVLSPEEYLDQKDAVKRVDSIYNSKGEEVFIICLFK